MTDSTTRRGSISPPRLVGRAPEDYAQELQDHLEVSHDRAVNGLPAGFNSVTPGIITLDAVATVGEEVDGWAAASHSHAIDLGLVSKGDLLTRDDAGYAYLGVGADGEVLTADAASLTGLTWALPNDGLTWVPLTTLIAGVPELVWDADGNLVMTQVAL